MGRVAVQRLRTGMVLGADVLRPGQPATRPLVRRGQMVTPSLKQALRRAGVAVVEVAWSAERQKPEKVAWSAGREDPEKVHAPATRVAPPPRERPLQRLRLPLPTVRPGAPAGRSFRAPSGELVALATPLTETILTALAAAGVQ